MRACFDWSAICAISSYWLAAYKNGNSIIRLPLPSVSAPWFRCCVNVAVYPDPLVVVAGWHVLLSQQSIA